MWTRWIVFGTSARVETQSLDKKISKNTRFAFIPRDAVRATMSRLLSFLILCIIGICFIGSSDAGPFTKKWPDRRPKGDPRRGQAINVVVPPDDETATDHSSVMFRMEKELQELKEESANRAMLLIKKDEEISLLNKSLARMRYKKNTALAASKIVKKVRDREKTPRVPFRNFDDYGEKTRKRRLLTVKAALAEKKMTLDECAVLHIHMYAEFSQKKRSLPYSSYCRLDPARLDSLVRRAGRSDFIQSMERQQLYVGALRASL